MGSVVGGVSVTAATLGSRTGSARGKPQASRTSRARRLDHLATLTRNTNKVAGTEVTFDQLTEATPTQRKAFELLGIPIPLRIT